MSDNQPDFDNMTPEEIMAWMETLAKRQGASEGFTTAADMQIAEIDPDPVVIDEPGYVPYGQERSQPAEPPPAPARPASPPPAAAQPPPTPVRSTQPTPAVPPLVRSTQPTPAAAQPPPPPPSAASVPTMLTTPTPPQRPPEPAKADPPVDEGALAWLESLAADQGDGLFNLDLSGFSGEVDEIPAAPAQPVNPMNWLEDLARAQSPDVSSLEQFERTDAAAEYDEEESEKLDPYGEGVNPMEWLETLALRQGANREELTTPAGMNIPAPEDAEVEDDDYQPFSFDTLPTRRSVEPTPVLENPADWLNAIADAQGYSEEGVRATQPDSADMSMSGIQDAITHGTVTAEQMQYFLDRQADELANLPPEDEYDDEDDIDTALHPAELPDWLSDLKPQVAAPDPSQSIDALFEAPAASDMPDWLKQDVLGSDIDSDLERIFEPEEESSRPLEPEAAGFATDILVDATDPWVEALDEEYEQGGMANIDEVPEWYEQNLRDEQRLAVIEGRSDDEADEDTSLVEAALPEESNLSAGQPQSIPAWLGGTEPVLAEEEPEPAVPAPAPEPEPAVFQEIPDWLKEVESAVSPQNVPDWLIDSISVEDKAEPDVVAAPVADIFVEPEPEPAPPVVVAPPAPRPTPVVPPQPVTPPPARVSTGTVPALEGARDREQSGDLEGALADYEGLIRASVDLDAVVADLTQLVKSYKTVPAVYRVLGDGLMRQGKLQAALNTYREALNQL
jgi:hypothetical protein